MTAALIVLWHALFFSPQSIPFPGPGMAHSTGASPIALIGHVAAGSSDNVSAVTAEMNTTGASLLVCGAATDNTAASFTDSNTNTWTALTKQGSDGTINFQLRYVANPTVSSGHTFTATNSGNLPSIACLAFSNVVTSSPLDAGSDIGAFEGNIQTLQPGSFTPSVANAVVITGVGINLNGSSPSVDSPFTLADAGGRVAAQHQGYGLAYEIQTTAAARNPTWSSGGSFQQYAVVLAAFKHN